MRKNKKIILIILVITLVALGIFLLEFVQKQENVIGDAKVNKTKENLITENELKTIITESVIKEKTYTLSNYKNKNDIQILEIGGRN